MKMLRRGAFALMFALCLTACAVGEDALLIVPGTSVGPIRIGDTKERLIEIMGKPDLEGTTDTQPVNYTEQYYKKKLTFMVLNGKVHLIFVQDPAYHLLQGVGVNSSVSDVETALGRDYTRKDAQLGPELLYAALGVRFVCMGQQVIGIEVRAPTK